MTVGQENVFYIPDRKSHLLHIGNYLVRGLKIARIKHYKAQPRVDYMRRCRDRADKIELSENSYRLERAFPFVAHFIYLTLQDI